MIPRTFRVVVWLTVAFLLQNTSLWAQAPATNSALDQKPIDSATNFPFKVIGPGLYQYGNIRMDKSQRTVSFPAVLNHDQGAMEYFLVTGYGKTHESILRTEVKPYDIHIAMLLLGTTSTNRSPSGSSAEELRSQISNPSKEAPPGDKVTIDVLWTENGKAIKRSARELIYNEDIRASPGDLAWVYNGSIVARGKFLAQIEGSIVSLVTDPIALVNNIGSGHDNDRIWGANTNNLPPAGVPLQVAIKLEGAAEKSQ